MSCQPFPSKFRFVKILSIFYSILQECVLIQYFNQAYLNDKDSFYHNRITGKQTSKNQCYFAIEFLKADEVIFVVTLHLSFIKLFVMFIHVLL